MSKQRMRRGEKCQQDKHWVITKLGGGYTDQVVCSEGMDGGRCNTEITTKL
jgi:hypothetical protein